MDSLLSRGARWLAALCWLLPLNGRAQDSLNFPVLGEVVRLHDGLDALLDPQANLEAITSGYVWSEGPVWNKEGQYLLFSDIPRNSVMKWVEGKGASVYLQPSGYTGAGDYGNEPGSNGLIFDPEGSLISGASRSCGRGTASARWSIPIAASG